jgi:hypothetical protein
MTAPITFTWDGESMVPQKRFQQLCDKQYVIGETYPLVVHEPRSSNSHNHYFASLTEAWSNLPDDISAQFPTVDHLRKFALIKAGFRDERSVACSSKAEAQRVAAFVKPIDDFAIVTVVEAMVTIYTAKSQSMRAMGKTVFQDSKDKVLDIAWGFCGTTAREAASHVGRAA